MSRLIKTSEVLGLPVVTIDGGEDVAEIKDVVYGSEEGRLLGFTLNKRGFLTGRLRAALPAAAAASIGPDAVMIENAESCLASLDEAPDAIVAPDGNRNVLGNQVMTEGGTLLGVISDLVLFLGGDGEVVGFELTREGTKDVWFVPRPAQLAISGEVLLVPDSIETYISDDFTGFGGAIDRFRSDHWEAQR